MFVLDLYVLGFQCFDVILVMEWMKLTSVRLDCGRKNVVWVVDLVAVLIEVLIVVLVVVLAVVLVAL